MKRADSEKQVSFLDDDEPVSSWVAPPPSSSEGKRSAEGEVASKKPGSSPSRSRKGHRFEAELDVAELDDRGRPVSTWGARGRELDRSVLIFMSRRMCYPGRHVVVAVHLIDSTPVPLFGRVRACEYEGDGLCRVELDLLEVPEDRPIRDWLDAIIRRLSAAR
ncbi:MAG: hypothetical protein KF902_08780 [Phycisphaeraceae bacterium]|nr:hypothetical protein [Phycisphaeraceae bacterium]